MENGNSVEKFFQEKTNAGFGKKKILIIIVAVIIALGAGGAFRAVQAKTFPKSTKINGVDVSGLNKKEAEEKINKESNRVTIVEDGKEPTDVETMYTYDTDAALQKKLMLSSLDPRLWVGVGVNYGMTLKVKDGVKETAEALSAALPDAEGVALTSDAYIDLDKMEIVAEVQGNNTDFVKLSEKIADQRDREPRNEKFQFDRSKFAASPAVKSADLKAELAFDKKYLANGLNMNSPEGYVYHVTPQQLSKVIVYEKSEPKYSKEGATAVVEEIASTYSRKNLTVKTLAGNKTMRNFALSDSFDKEKTAESLYKAAKEGGEGQLVVADGAAEAVATHVEINLSSQTVSVVSNGTATFSTPVVTGGPGYRTPTGIYKIKYKATHVTLRGKNADGTDYESPVNYWMPFNGGIGFHDANWRGAFGGSIYVGSGSHGCINMPPSVTGRFFGMVSAGTVVYVYQ